MINVFLFVERLLKRSDLGRSLWRFWSEISFQQQQCNYEEGSTWALCVWSVSNHQEVIQNTLTNTQQPTHYAFTQSKPTLFFLSNLRQWKNKVKCAFLSFMRLKLMSSLPKFSTVGNEVTVRFFDRGHKRYNRSSPTWASMLVLQ